MPAVASATSHSRDTSQPLVLETDALTVRFGEQNVLRNISIQIPRGQTLAVLGESGCGKTVLLKAMIGLVRPSLGEVRFEGKALSGIKGSELDALRTGYGFVFQGAALFDSLTIADNIAFPLREHTHLLEPEIRDIVDSLLAEVGLPRSVANQKPVQLSGGMRKRAGVARALALDPHLILYDEPTTGLDPIMSDVINELILRVRSRDDVTSIVVTHDLASARKVADRIVMLYPLARLGPEEEQIIFDGTPVELAEATDPRICQFIEGRAGARLTELHDEQARALQTPSQLSAEQIAESALPEQPSGDSP
ncbi:MAG: ATP-binding cassette domain-containing protein [Planctomycetia bacterium]|nr:ATP-binding cassette domain-containing protein [Planctomycetia bacterium]RLT13644.1 MAG: ATP-binding cassette domain-containing protein [Planctomycetota bacterium]